MLGEGRIDEGLIVTAASRMNLRLEPLENGVIEANSDAGLAGRKGIDGASLGPTEIVFTLHG